MLPDPRPRAAAAPTEPIRPFHVMAKPNGPRCNLACTYCYYLEKERLYPGTRQFRMGAEVLETFVRDYIASQSRLGVREIWFAWQGGEPTMLGLDFFRTVVELEHRYCPAGHVVRNALQTNGTLLDPDWAAFLKGNAFLVGLSIDGPRREHDRYRVDRRQRPTFVRAMTALDLLRRSGVEFNVLTVVHRQNARRPREVYSFLKREGVTFMQFIPLVERAAGDGAAVTPWSVTPAGYGEFLCGLFDAWIARDVGRVFVQFFDVQLGLWLGEPSGLCWFAERCGAGLALEHNGDVYACDHYVDPEHLLGNIRQMPIDALAAAPAQRRFGDAKHDTLPRCCRECVYRFACNGGCPKHRFLRAPDGAPGLNYLCASYQRFFAHAGPRLQAMADLVRLGEPAARVMVPRRAVPSPRSAGVAVGRNDPCPCGSGRKHKRCCARIA